MAQAGMGLAAGDVDGDGLADLFVTNFAEDYSTFYRNTGKLLFRDETPRAGVNQATSTSSSPTDTSTRKRTMSCSTD